MITKTYSAAVSGIDGYIIDVECYIDDGFSDFDIIGLPDTSVRESCSRIHAAIKNSGYDFPDNSITVNLAPADIPKKGTGYDLAIFISLMKNSLIPERDISKMCFAGEISLSGVNIADGYDYTNGGTFMTVVYEVKGGGSTSPSYHWEVACRASDSKNLIDKKGKPASGFKLSSSYKDSVAN